MSGFEIAGLVLGAYPILTWACGRYKLVFEGLEGWMTFRARFEEFLLSLETERCCYKATLRRLLCNGPDPYFHSFEQADELLNDGCHAEWSGHALEQHLRLRLGEKYDTAVAIIKKLDSVMSDLYPLLGTSRGQLTIDESRSRAWWQEKLHQTKFSFSTKRYKRLSQLKTLNQDLDRLVCNNNDSETLRKVSYPKPANPVLHRVKENATGLHHAVKSVWNCSCRGDHVTKLRLQNFEDCLDDLFHLRFSGLHQMGDREGKVDVSYISNDVHTAGEVLEIPSSPNSSQADMLNFSLPNYGRQLQDASTLTILPYREARTGEYHRPLGDWPAVKGVRIKSLCESLRSTGTRAKTPYISHGGQIYRFTELRRVEGLPSLNLSKALEQEILNMKQRARLASALSLSALPLIDTPWVERSIHKTNIDLVFSNVVSHADPYIASPMTTNSAGETKDVSGRPDHFSSPLIQFGILLLELCFGKTIESRITRNDWLAKNEKPKNESLFIYTTALDWSTEVDDNFPGFKKPIELCLKRTFGEKLDWSSDELRETINFNLVQPLNDILVQNGWNLG